MLAAWMVAMATVAWAAPLREAVPEAAGAWAVGWPDAAKATAATRLDVTWTHEGAERVAWGYAFEAQVASERDDDGWRILLERPRLTATWREEEGRSVDDGHLQVLADAVEQGTIAHRVQADGMWASDQATPGFARLYERIEIVAQTRAASDVVGTLGAMGVSTHLLLHFREVPTIQRPWRGDLWFLHGAEVPVGFTRRVPNPSGDDTTRVERLPDAPCLEGAGAPTCMHVRLVTEVGHRGMPDFALHGSAFLNGQRTKGYLGTRPPWPEGRRDDVTTVDLWIEEEGLRPWRRVSDEVRTYRMKSGARGRHVLRAETTWRWEVAAEGRAP